MHVPISPGVSVEHAQWSLLEPSLQAPIT